MVAYPIMLDLRERNCLVVGGGEVAKRKVTSLLYCCAKVTVIAPVICPAIKAFFSQNRIDYFARKYIKGDIKGFSIVIAATDSWEVNSEIAKEAHKDAILVNVADDLERSSFTVPSVLRRGDLTVAIGTQGKSPLLSKRLREMLEDILSAEYKNLLEELWKTREGLRDSKIRPGEKEQLYEEIIRKSGLMR